MPKSLENPFLPSHGAKPDLSALAEQGFLPPDEVAKLRELESQKNRSSEFGIQSSLSDVSLEEGMSAQERQEQKESQELPRKEIIEWAKKWNLGDEDWVDKKFDFQPNGTVVCDGGLVLSKLTEPDFPKYIVEVKGYLYLSRLTSAEHLEFPTTIGGDLDLSRLTSTEHLKLPATIGGDLYLNNLTSAEHLTLPTTIGGSLYLNSLTSAEHLELTDIAGGVFLRRLSEEKKQQLREKYPHLSIK